MGPGGVGWQVSNFGWLVGEESVDKSSFFCDQNKKKKMRILRESREQRRQKNRKCSWKFDEGVEKERFVISWKIAGGPSTASTQTGVFT